MSWRFGVARPHRLYMTVSLLPREHGAYAQFSLPMLTALASTWPSLAALSMSAAAIAVFLSHEPIAILFGMRGTRALREERARCVRRLVILAIVAVVGGVGGLVMASPIARLAVALPLTLALPATLLMARKKERTLVGELLAVAMLSTVSLPIALASGVSIKGAGIAACVWISVFGAATLLARALIRKTDALPRWALAVVGASPMVVATGFVGVSFISLGVVAALVPTCLLCIALAVSPPPPKRIRMVGWSLAASSIFTCAVLASLPVR